MGRGHVAIKVALVVVVLAVGIGLRAAWEWMPGAEAQDIDSCAVVANSSYCY